MSKNGKASKSTQQRGGKRDVKPGTHSSVNQRKPKSGYQPSGENSPSKPPSNPPDEGSSGKH